MAVHCTECGLVGSEGASYCSRCGAYLLDHQNDRASVTTVTYMVDDATGVMQPVSVDEELAVVDAVLVVRSGGAHVGEIFPLQTTSATIGRQPSCEIFLDDVTVSREHAIIVFRDGCHYIDDAGSLNGTYVNRKRVDSHLLAEGDELQIGKFKLVYHVR